jgi:hypothetical protein
MTYHFKSESRIKNLESEIVKKKNSPETQISPETICGSELYCPPRNLGVDSHPRQTAFFVVVRRTKRNTRSTKQDQDPLHHRLALISITFLTNSVNASSQSNYCTATSER